MQRTSARRRIPSTNAVLVRVGALALILIVASFAAYRFGWFDYRHTLEHVARLRKSHSFVGFVIGFVLIYALGTSVGIPGMPFTVAAGVLFGTLLGSALSWGGAMVGSAIGYWVARTIGHDVVMRWLQRYKRANAAVADAQNFGGMLRLRLLPVIPLGTANFVGGLARVPFARYLLATAIGIAPSTVIFTYFADSLLEGVGNGHADAMRSLVISSVLLILLSLTPKLFARRERGKELERERDLVTSSRSVRSG